MPDRDLRASLELRGAINPAYEFEGELIDGRRRKSICDELRKPLEIRVCETLQEACGTLFLLHPERALELARSRGFSSILQLADLCGTTTSAIARLIAVPKKSHKKSVKSAHVAASSRPRMLRRLVTFEPELYELAKVAARQAGHGNFAKVVRDSLWRTIRDNVSGAPLQQPRRVQPANGARRRTG